MKKMNKVAAAVLAAAMVGSMAVPAFAEPTPVTNVGTPSTGTTTVKYELGASYKWTIPTEVNFYEHATGNNADVKEVKDQTVKVEDNIIAPSSSVVIKIDANEDFKIALENHVDTTRDFTVEMNGTVLNKGDEVLKVASGTKEKSTTLTFKLTDTDVKVAGNYEGTLAFEASVATE